MISLNDETDSRLCFGCGPRNKSGLQLQFQRDDEKVITYYTASKYHQGFPNILHGGIISTLLDEVMSRVSVLENQWTMTARMDIRFRQPVMTHQTIKAIGEKIRDRGGFFEARGRIYLPDGSIAADGTGTFSPVSNQTLSSMANDYPILANEWMVPKQQHAPRSNKPTHHPSGT